jgi:Haem-binding domain
MNVRNKFKSRLTWMLAGAAVLAGLLQFTNPARTNPAPVGARDFLATNPPPEQVAVLIRNACYDCHSAETKWPWYSRVAPISWWVVGHVNDGRRHLNFSDWPQDDPRRARKKWNRIAEQIRYHDMPLSSYTWLHPEARLDAAQRDQIARWADQESQRLESEADIPARH